MEFNTSATQYTLRDLTPNTVVVFSVRAYTIIGPGENVTDQASTTSVREFILSSLCTSLILYIHSVARVTRVRAVALNNTAVNVSWTPVTIQETDHIFTIHYTAVGGTKRQSSSGKNFEKTSSPLVTCTHLKLSCPAAGTVNVTAGSSSGVVGGLMTGEQYRFSVSVTVSGSGRTYTGPVSNPSDPITVRAPPSDNGEYNNILTNPTCQNARSSRNI